jgi:EAL domain-containing protein (putative c-di-GMP-specific phosphodiesterase class I)
VGNEVEAARFVAAMHEAGCNTALSQFGRSELSFRLLKACRPSFLKIDGNIVLSMLRDRVAHAKIKAIAQVSRTVGAATVAELVEDPQTLAALRAAGVDYAQGFGIARPRPIEELETVALR